MRKLLIGIFFVCSLIPLTAQQTLIYTHPDMLFEQGKEFYNQRKYAASYRSFEDFLKTVDKTQAGQIHEAEYYMVADAYELRQENVFFLIQDFLKKHPYTTFYDKVNSMLGVLLYEQKDYAGALAYFNRVNPARFGQRERVEFLFCKGYALLETGKYAEAADIFRPLRLQESDYQIDAIYYYAYAEYTLKNYEEALPEFQKIENEEKYKQKVVYYLVQIYYLTGDLAEVDRLSDFILKTYPDSPDNSEIYRIRGELAYASRNYQEAIENLQRYESMSSQMLRNDLYIMGISNIRTQKYNSAIPYLQKVTTEPDSLTENTYMHLGNAFVRINDKVNARLAYEAALRTNFDSRVREEALLNYALTTYETTSAFGESISAFEQFLQEFPNSRSANKVKTYLANEYMSTKNYEVAYQSIQKIAQPNDKILEAKQYILYQLGTQAFTLNDFEKAVNYFNLSIQNAPRGPYAAESYYWRSESYFRLNMPEKSISDLKTYLGMSNANKNRNYVMAHYGMGYAYFSQQDFRTSRRYFEQYTNLEKNKQSDVFADALNRIGDCYFYERDFSNAEIMYSRSANLSPNTGDYALFQSAYVAGLQKKYTSKISRLNDLVASYPNSEFVDDALYEIGRAYVMLNNQGNAITSYSKLLSMQPNSNSARKAALEIGMIYMNQEKLDEAIDAFKKVISAYPGSTEAYTALESMENIYVEKNDVPAYLNYAKSINMTLPGGVSANREDSISYIAAEKQYMGGNYSRAISGFRLYLNGYCSGGRYCTNAQYYLADSYYRTNDRVNALAEYRNVLKIQGNQFMEEACMRCAEITYDQKDFSTSLGYFRQFEGLAQTTERRNMARLGVLRCSYQLNDHQTTISIAGQIIADAKSASDVVAEAKYNRAKSYIATGNSSQALNDLKALSQDTRTAIGAESKYLLANVYFEQGSLATAEQEVLDFAKKNTPHQYWLARGFILLADIYIQQGKDFQAKQYLLSLQRNYTTQDDIQQMIESRLTDISGREKSQVIG